MPVNPNHLPGWLIGQDEYEEILTKIKNVPANQAFDAAVRVMLTDYQWIRGSEREIIARQLAQARRGAEAFQGAGTNTQLRPSQVADSRRMQEHAANKLGLPINTSAAQWQYDIGVNIAVTTAPNGDVIRYQFREFITSSTSLSRMEAEAKAIESAKGKIDRTRRYEQNQSVVVAGVTIFAVRLGY